MSYKVTAPLVVIKNAETGSDWYGAVGTIVPTGHNDKRCKELVKEGMLEVVKDSKSEKPSDDTPAKSDKVEDILAEVGEDKEKAAAALELENAKGDKARSTLVEKLQAIISAEA